MFSPKVSCLRVNGRNAMSSALINYMYMYMYFDEFFLSCLFDYCLYTELCPNMHVHIHVH